MSIRCSVLNKRGQSFVEITLIAPLLLAALYVAIDFGGLFFTTHYTQNAVREASRIGSILPDCAINPAVPCVKNNSQLCTAATDTVVVEACNRLPKRLVGARVEVALTGTYYPADCMREIQVLALGTYAYGLYRVVSMFGAPVPTNPQIIRKASGRYQIQPVTVTGVCP